MKEGWRKIKERKKERKNEKQTERKDIKYSRLCRCTGNKPITVPSKTREYSKERGN